MTTELDFQQQLDANPDDWKMRLLLASWLEKRHDMRALGYRALAAQKRVPNKSRKTEAWWWGCTSPDPADLVLSGDLWQDWFSLLPIDEGDNHFWPAWTVNSGIKTRRECEDAAALAFAQLPAQRQAELLGT